MSASTAAGAKLFIGTTAADAATDTYIEVGEVESIGEFGRTYAEITWSPINSRGVQKFKGSFNDGTLALGLGKDTSDAGQAALRVALDLDYDFNFKVQANDGVAPVTHTVTISVATPGVFTKVAHGLTANTELLLATSAADLPLGLTAGTVFVKTVLSADTFTVSATAGGTAITTTDAGTGTHTVTTVPAGSYQTLKAKVMAMPTNFGSGPDNVIKVAASLSIKSGSLAEMPRLPAV